MLCLTVIHSTPANLTVIHVYTLLHCCKSQRGGCAVLLHAWNSFSDARHTALPSGWTYTVASTAASPRQVPGLVFPPETVFRCSGFDCVKPTLLIPSLRKLRSVHMSVPFICPFRCPCKPDECIKYGRVCLRPAHEAACS